MFLKDPIYSLRIFSNNNFFDYLNIDNIARISRRKIIKYDKAAADKPTWIRHKHRILWNWVNINFGINESFVNHLERNIKKLNLQMSPQELQFLFTIKGLFFATWRPLKEIVVRFELDKKETIYFFESEGNVYRQTKEEKEKIVNTHLTSGDFYFSNKRLFICGPNQKIKRILNYDEITKIEFGQFGTVLTVNNDRLLLRSENKYMSYVVFQRILPKFKLNINKIEGLYNYFDFWNKLLLKIN